MELMLTAFTAGLFLITISELGDKTFFIAVVMSMRYPRRLVLIGVIAALSAMTVLSVIMGRAISFLPKEIIDYLEIALFLFFGLKLLFDAWKMKPNSGGEIVREAEEAIEDSQKSSQKRQTNWSIIVQTFVLTFIAEWGDRTQIATITLAASNNPIGVTVGAILGHSICALIAVFGGKMIAGRISERTVTGIGGFLFLVFAGVASWEMYLT